MVKVKNIPLPVRVFAREILYSARRLQMAVVAVKPGN
jgi:hypothetical protein